MVDRRDQVCEEKGEDMEVMDIVKSLAQTIRQIGNIELYRQILDLQAGIMDMLDENLLLKQEIRQLKDKRATQESLRFEDNVYWKKDPDGAERAYCSCCWDTKERLVRLHKQEIYEPAGVKAHRWYCPGCEKGVPMPDRGGK